MTGLMSFGQNYIGYYQNNEKVGIKGDGSYLFVSTSVNLKSDSKFSYIFTGCDVFADSAVGTFYSKDNMIFLSYTTPDFYDSYQTDTIWQKSDINKTSNYKIDTTYQHTPNLSCSFRPNILKIKGKKLIIVSYQEPSTENDNLKSKLQRITVKEWDESGLLYLKIKSKDQ